MRIDLLCNDGSPLGVTSRTIWGDNFRVGTGGAEYGLLTMCEEWTKAGHTVRLYNDPKEKNASLFEQFPVGAFHPNDDRDILIIFRSPNARAIPANGLKIWWSCDQQTVGNFNEFANYVDKIVCISEYHSNYFKSRYNITNATVIDLPIRLGDFEGLKFERVKNRIIFTSVPARGLENMLRVYKILKQEKPEVSMTITSDYRLWGVGASNEQFRMKWMHQSDVRYLGAIPRGQLIEEQLQADLMVYPCNYDELFCIAVAVAQCAGLYPVTSSIGALETTNMAKLLFVDADNPACDRLYVDTVLELLSDRSRLEVLRTKNKFEARARFAPENILRQWEEVFK